MSDRKVKRQRTNAVARYYWSHAEHWATYFLSPTLPEPRGHDNYLTEMAIGAYVTPDTDHWILANCLLAELALCGDLDGVSA